jgi:hypothetical protein
MAALHRPMVLGSSSPRGRLPNGGRIRFSIFLRVPYSEAGCCSFQAGHHLVVTYSPEQGPGLGRVRLGPAGEWLPAGALERPPLGLSKAQGGEDASRALVGAVLVTDLVALLGVAGRGWDNRDPGHYHASVSQVTG